MSNWHTNPLRPSEILTEETVKRAIDALVSYRSKDVLLAIAAVWGTILAMTFTLIVTVRAAFHVF